MAASLTTVDIAKWQADSDIDWAALKAGGVTSVIIQLSHGHSQEEEAAAHIASAEKYGIIWHGYHFYEGTAGEVEYSTSNAQAMGLKSGAYMFLDMEGNIGGDWQQQFYDFRTVWLSAGWKTGVYTSDSPYTAKFDDAELTADGVYRWIAAYSYEPANYDIWQYSSTGGVPGYSKDIDKDYDRSGKLSIDYTAVKTDPYNPPNPVAGAHVGVGVDTTGLAGGQAYGYSTNGSDFYTALSPYGFIFRQRDADRMWPLIKPKIGTIQGAKGDKGDTGPAGKDGIQGPKGDTGAPGADGKDGAAATIAVGTVTTGAAGTNASVTNAGTASAAKLNFTIPQGAKGDKGDTGAQGPAGDGTKFTTTLLPNGTDMNTVQTPGFYYNPGDAATATMSNTPSPHAFSMWVTQSAGVRQFWFEYMTGGGRFYTRGLYAGAWGAWHDIAVVDNANTWAGNQTYTGQFKLQNSGPTLLMQPGGGGGTTQYAVLRGLPGTDGNGMGVSLGAGGTTIVGGGESASTLLTDIQNGTVPSSISPVPAKGAMGDESAYFTSDGHVHIVTNMQNNDANAKDFKFDYSGNLTLPTKGALIGGVRVRDDGDGTTNWARGSNNTPDWYLTNAPAQTVKEFKNWGAMGFPTLSTGDKPNYAVIETTSPGSNSGYGFARQVAWPTTTSGMPVTLVRIGTSATAWGAWKEVTYW